MEQVHSGICEKGQYRQIGKQILLYKHTCIRTQIDVSQRLYVSCN